MDHLDDFTVDALERALITAERTVARARGLQLALIAELDRRQVANGDGCRSMAEWVAGRLDLSPETARTLAMTARRFTETPELAESLNQGAVTYDRAVELARGGDASPEEIRSSLAHDIAGLRRLASLRHRLTSAAEGHLRRTAYVAIQPNLDSTRYRLWGELPGYEGRVVEKALDERADDMPLDPIGRPALGTRRADALVAIAEESLVSDAAPASGPTVTVFVDAGLAAGSGGEAGVSVDTGARVGPETLRRLLCEGSVEVNAAGAQPLALGRKTRVIPPRLQRSVLHRDGGCTADACTSTYRLQPHHVVPWSEGGRTDPENLTTLCWYHHHVVVHGRGMQIDPQSPPQRRRFLRTGREPPDR